MHRLALATLLTLAGTPLLIGCGPSARSSQFPTLANSGVLPLSTNNPYVGANLFISSEFERSPFLLNFLKGRGGPTAIEIIEDTFGPTRVIMYYPGEREVYAADIIDERGRGRQWVIKGPYAIERQDFRALAELQNSLHGEPVFLLNGRPHRFRFQRADQPVTEIVHPRVPPPAPTPQATPKPKPKAKPITAPSTPGTPAPTPSKEFKPLNSDQRAILLSQGFADRADNGDVIHEVKGTKETPEMIAKWYTGSAANAKAVADANTVTPDAVLATGRKVFVPVKLVKNFKAMPAEGG